MPSEVYLMPFLSVLASVVLVIASLYWAKAVLIPLALALMLTFLLQPIVAALHRRGLGHMPAVVLVVMLLGLVLVAVGGVVIMQFSSLAAELPSYQDNLKHKIDDLQSMSQGGVLEKIQETFAELTRQFEHNPPSTAAAQEPVAVQHLRVLARLVCALTARLSGGCWPGVGAAPVHPHGLRRLTGSLVPSHWLRALDGHHQSPRRSRAAHQPLVADAGDRQWHVRVRRGPRAVLLRAPVCPAVGLVSRRVALYPLCGAGAGGVAAHRPQPGGVCRVGEAAPGRWALCPPGTCAPTWCWSPCSMAGVLASRRWRY